MDALTPTGIVPYGVVFWPRAASIAIVAPITPSVLGTAIAIYAARGQKTTPYGTIPVGVSASKLSGYPQVMTKKNIGKYKCEYSG